MSVARAEADLARLQNEMGRLRSQLAEAETRAVKIAHYLEMARVYEAGEDAIQPAIRARGGNAAHIASMAREALREHGEPMQTRPLVDILLKRGVTLGNGNPVNYLSGVLSRAEDFENDRITGWHLTNWQTALNPEPPMNRTTQHDHADEDDAQDHPESRADPLLRLAAD